MVARAGVDETRRRVALVPGKVFARRTLNNEDATDDEGPCALSARAGSSQKGLGASAQPDTPAPPVPFGTRSRSRRKLAS